MTTEAIAPRRAGGSRVSARLRIVGWIVLTAAVGLAALIVTVDRTMQADVAGRANTAVEQELAEFSQFAAQGLDPETAQPFSSVSRLFEVYLSRQQLEDTEVLLGRIGASGEWLQARGAHVQPGDFAVLDQNEAALLGRVLGERSGVASTAAGEIRWGSRQVGTGEQEAAGTFGVVMFVGPLAHAAAETTRLLVVVGLGSLLLIAAMSYAVAGQILRPVRDVRRAAAEISEHDLSRRIPVTGRDDVSEVAVQFNAMLDRLESAFRAEQRFVDDAGHELRTPITVILGHLELLGDDLEERRATLALVTQELDRMSRIVSDLLSLAKAERPDFIQLRPGVDLAALTFDIDAKVQALGDRRWGLSHVAEGTCEIDAERLTQAVLQLAQNAVEHTTPASRIVLCSRVDHGSAPSQAAASVIVPDTTPPTAAIQTPPTVAVSTPRISAVSTPPTTSTPLPATMSITRPVGSGRDHVQDTPLFVVSVTDDGPGVHPDDAPYLFDRFARGAHGKRTGSGAGLGLAIVRSIAEAHGGWAFLDPGGGPGATFGVVVPARGYRPSPGGADDDVPTDGDQEASP